MMFIPLDFLCEGVNIQPAGPVQQTVQCDPLDGEVIHSLVTCTPRPVSKYSSGKVKIIKYDHLIIFTNTQSKDKNRY